MMGLPIPVVFLAGVYPAAVLVLVPEPGLGLELAPGVVVAAERSEISFIHLRENNDLRRACTLPTAPSLLPVWADPHSLGSARQSEPSQLDSAADPDLAYCPFADCPH